MNTYWHSAFRLLPVLVALGAGGGAFAQSAAPSDPPLERAAKTTDDAQETTEEPEKRPEAPPAAEKNEPATTRKNHRRIQNTTDQANSMDRFPFGDHTLLEGETAREVVSILGSSRVAGDVQRAAVSILGDTTVDGRVGREAVAVLGNVRVNGEVKGQVVAVLGNVDLGPKAIVDGQIVVVAGKLIKEPGAVVHGKTTQVASFGAVPAFTGLRTWFYHCLLLGRLLAFEPDLGWAWAVAGLALALYVLLALLFPTGVEKCLQTLQDRPGKSLLTTVAVVVLTPVLLLLLAVTGVGVFLIPFISVGMFAAGLFGRAVIQAWIGRRITGAFVGGRPVHAALAVLVGGAIVTALYVVPVLALLVWKLLGLLGLGVVIYTLILNSRDKKAAAFVSSRTDMGSGYPAASFPAANAGDAQPSVIPAPLSPPSPMVFAALPRAGFWIRMAALLLDLVLVGVVAHSIGGGRALLLLIAIYAAVLWKLKGSTVGGIICGLKVVRLDDRPVDWSVAIVRALGCFLSLAVAGLGFIWVAFDDEHQSWHDKVAGTIVVRVPKGVSLV